MIIGLVLFIVLVFQSMGIVGLFVPEQYQWVTYGFTSLLSDALAFITWAWVTDYKHVEAKSALWITAGITSTQAILYWPYVLLDVQPARVLIYILGVVLGVGGVIIDYRRRSNHTDDSLNDQDFFELCRRPDKPLHLFLSWWSPEPGGGRIFIVRGVLYRFKKDYFIKTSCVDRRKILDKYMVRRVRPATDADISYLESQLGKKWQLFGNNCVKISNTLRSQKHHAR